MRILWLLRYEPGPPATGGDAVYSRKLVEYTALSADVTALCYAGQGVGLEDRPGLTWRRVPGVRASKIASLFSPLPSVAHRHRHASYIAEMEALAREADAVVVDHVGMFWAVERLKAALGSGCPPVIVVNHDHEASLRTDMVRGVKNPLFARALLWDAWKAGRLEKIANRAADGLTAITTTDRDAFGDDAPQTPSLLLMPGYDGPVVEARTISQSTPRAICILGGRSSFHKQMILRMILDAVVARGLTGSCAVHVVGGGDDPATKRKSKDIQFHGYIDNLAAFFENVRLGLIPDEVGGGFKLRALTHVFHRVPMLALTKALNGMTLEEGAHFIGAASIDDMIAKTPAALDDVSGLDALQTRAFEHWRTGFAWEDRGRDVVHFARLALRTPEPGQPEATHLSPHAGQRGTG